MLGSGSVHASKVEDMSRKTSVLGALLVSDDTWISIRELSPMPGEFSAIEECFLP